MFTLPALHAYIRVVRSFPVPRLDLNSIEFKIFGVLLPVQLHVVRNKLQALCPEGRIYCVVLLLQRLKKIAFVARK